MNDHHRSLWNRIEAFELDDATSEFPFSARLAKENGWSRHFAARVIAEYKCFLFLCVTADHVACPSDQVDQAWHLHLTFTRSYWNALCREVLERQLHHGPTKGGATENHKHVDLYERTLRSYRAAFGNEPPADIWPAVDLRFGEDVEHRRVNLRRSWVIPKFRLPRIPGQHGKAHLVGALCVPPLGVILNPFTLPGPVFLVLYGALYVVSVVTSIFLRSMLRETDDGQKEQLSPNSAASLAHADIAPIFTTICRLIQSDSLKLVHVNKGKIFKQESFRIKVKGPLPKDTESRRKGSLALAIYERAGGQQGVELSYLMPNLFEHVADIRGNLEERGLLESDASYSVPRLVPRYLLGGLLVFGGIKLVVGLTDDRPVGFLILSMVVTGFTLAVLSMRPRRTRKGDRVLKALQLENEHLKQLDANKKLSPDQLAMAAGLFGLGAFSAIGFESIQAAWQRSFRSYGYGHSGCGSGGGGGGGGGGCGGCGGE